MFGSRRLAKRSIVGSRVCAPWQDGRFYPGVIQSTTPQPNGDDLYTIYFDGGYTRSMMDCDIVGPGFQNITATKLEPGQKVFVTHNGREVAGVVLKHDWDTDEVLISVQAAGLPDTELVRRLEDVRLLESRKSARLQDQDTDYSRLADMHPEPKKRAVSHVIDVPLPAAKHSRRRKNTPEPEEMIMMDPQEEEDVVNMDVMDEHMAAMVLTSLSCSPVSPHFPSSLSDKGAVSPGASGSSIASSGVFMGKSESSTPSPPHVMSQSAPPAPVFGSPEPLDEGIGLDDTSAYFEEDTGAKKRRQSTRTVFQCTWPGCSKIHNTCSTIEHHVRTAHLGPKEGGDSDLSDHEEEFYYTEVEVTVDTVTETFADMYTSSPPQDSFMGAVRSMQDHDYQKKESRSVAQNIPVIHHHHDNSQSQGGGSFPLTVPIGIPTLSRSLSWQASSSQVSPPKKKKVPTATLR